MGVGSTEQLHSAFTRVVNWLLLLTRVFGQRHSCGERSREMSTAYCTIHGCMVYGTAALRSRELLTAYSTLQRCLVHSIAAIRFRARCQRLTAPIMCVGSTEQLHSAFTRVVNGLLHLTRVFDLRHSCSERSREVSTAYRTCHGCIVYGTAALRSRELLTDYSTLQGCFVYGTAAMRVYASC